MDWKVRGYTEAASEGIDYRSIVYYYRLPSVTGTSDLEFALSDPEGGRIAWSIPGTAVNAWQEIRVDRDERRVYRNGSPLAGASVSEDTATGSLDLLEITQTGTTNGLLYLDELYLTDPRGALGVAASLALDLDLPGTLWEVGGHPVLHDVRLRERAEVASAGFASLYGIPERTGRFTSRTELEAGVSLVDVDLAVDLAAQEGELTAGGSHRLEVPNVAFPLRVSDSYSYRTRETGQSLQRENRLSLDLAPLLQARFYNTAGNVDDVLTQEWGALLGLTPGPFVFDNSFQLIMGRSGFSLPWEGYLQNWAWGYTLLAPASAGDPLERKASLNLDWRYLPRPVGVSLLGSLDLHSYDLSTSGRDQAEELGFELGVPVELGSSPSAPGRQLRLEPGYRRALSLLTREASAGDVPADFATAASTIAGQRYGFSGIPLWELYDPRLAELFLAESLSVEAAAYTAESFLRVSRTFSSRLRDLLLPSYVELGIDRSFEREGDLARIANHYNLQSRWRAINLFGRFGAYPLVDWYRTDEYAGDLLVSLSTESGEVTSRRVQPGKPGAGDPGKRRGVVRRAVSVTGLVPLPRGRREAAAPARPGRRRRLLVAQGEPEPEAHRAAG